MSGSFAFGAALAGGALVGAGLLLVLLSSRRIAGVSGVVGGLVPSRAGDRAWRLAFLGGLLAGGLGLAVFAPERLAFHLDRSLPVLAGAGFLVGLGTRMGNGCTSGHGVCGLSLFSARSLVATAIFIATGAGTVYVIQHVVGGRL